MTTTLLLKEVFIIFNKYHVVIVMLLEHIQRRGHCPFALLAEMAEHAYGDARREWPEVELPAPTLDVSYSPATLSSL